MSNHTQHTYVSMNFLTKQKNLFFNEIIHLDRNKISSRLEQNYSITSSDRIIQLPGQNYPITKLPLERVTQLPNEIFCQLKFLFRFFKS